MAAQKVFLVLLRRPSRDKCEQRADPYYEFGSFGCTGCHKPNLFNPCHAANLEGARLAFAQGGQLGWRLVLLTPPIKVKVWKDRCEARWTPAENPFRYADAPVLVINDGVSDFPSIDRLARQTKRQTVEGGLSSLFRSRAYPLSPREANEVVTVYEQKYKDSQESRPSAIASKYYEALPKNPPSIDDNRKKSYKSRLRQLKHESGGGKGDLNNAALTTEGVRIQTRCGSFRPLKPGRRKRRCT